MTHQGQVGTAGYADRDTQFPVAIRCRNQMSRADMSTSRTSPSGMAQVVERNIQVLLDRRKTNDANRSRQEKIADAITGFTGSMKFVWLHLILFGSWIVINLGWVGIPPFDPSFVVLAMVASVEAIFLSTFILISQNRMMILADKRADLDLQVSLLAEHEITHLVKMVSEIARKMDIAEGHNPALEELKRDIPPEQVLDSIEKTESL